MPPRRRTGRSGHAAAEQPRTGQHLLEVQRPEGAFPDPRGLAAAGRRPRQGGGRRVAGAARGRTLALVGESGCGKTTVGQGHPAAHPPDRGQRDASAASTLRRCRAATCAARAPRLQIVFQDPYASLNPRMRVGDIVEEGMLAQGIGAGRRGSASACRRAAGAGGPAAGGQGPLSARILRRPAPAHRHRPRAGGGAASCHRLRRAHQRAGRLGAGADPEFAARSCRTSSGLAYLFITHNMSVVEYLAHEVAVMYLGRIVERGTVDEVLRAPSTPTRRRCCRRCPTIDGATPKVIRLEGDMPSPSNPPEGCHFHPRCPHVMDICRYRYPRYTKLSDTHRTNCFLYGEGNDR